MSEERSISKGLWWKLLERFGVQGVQFVLQIVLARILDPEHYGVLSIMIIFTTLANVFVQNGFNTALIQNKDVIEDDYSSVFWVSFAISAILYVVLFFAAPLIGAFYDIPDIVKPFRVIALMILPGAFNSVQLAKVSREMDFKKVFYSNVAGVVISGVAGIALAYKGFGLWALVVQQLMNVVIACIVMFFTVRWYPKFRCDLKRVVNLLSFGWKLLVSALMDTLYQDLRSLVIGKKYDSSTLGYYNRGKQFPQFFINAVNGAVQSVMLPAMAYEQDDKSKVKNIMRTSISVSAFVIFPLMAGLAGVATPLVSLLLTDKWLPCVPYMQIYCFTLAFYPVHSCNLQAINAVGRSDIYLKLEIVKKTYGIILLVLAVFLFDSPLAIAATGLITTFISCFVNAFPNKKLVGYSYGEQLRDMLPSFLASIGMFIVVLMIGQIGLSNVVTILLQVAVGVIVYFSVAFFAKIPALKLILAALAVFAEKESQED